MRVGGCWNSPAHKAFEVRVPVLNITLCVRNKLVPSARRNRFWDDNEWEKTVFGFRGKTSLPGGLGCSFSG